MPLYTLIETTTNDAFVRSAVVYLREHIHTAIADHGSCIIGLSGGSTPTLVYEALGKEKMDWSRVHLFLLDERYVPATDKDSNQTMIRETLLKNATVPEANIVFPDTALPIEECTKHYGMALRAQWAEHLPEVAILGMGDDGHIASLFPPLSDVALGDERLVIHTTTPSTGSGQADRFAVHDRISVSLNAIAAANAHLFLLKGEAKKRVWEEMMESKEDERRWPAKRIIASAPTEVVILG